jgi:glycogen operon protein
VWLTPIGDVMTQEDWGSGFGKSVAVFLNGLGISSTDTRGERITDDSFLMCFNGHDAAIKFILPPTEYAGSWQIVVDTSLTADDEEAYAAGDALPLPGRSLVVLRKLA